MDGVMPKMSAVPVRCMVLVNGLPCGYQPNGNTAKAQLTDLFTHQQGHLPQATPIIPNTHG